MGKSGNPAKRATVKQASSASGNGPTETAIYHVMKADEDFDTTAEMIYQMVQQAIREHPGTARHLYLDIDGHRNEAGGWDADAFEIQKEFLIGYMSPWLTAMSIPLGGFRSNGSQRDDLPARLLIFPGGKSASRTEDLAALAAETGQPVYDSETGESVRPDGTRTQD